MFNFLRKWICGSDLLFIRRCEVIRVLQCEQKEILNNVWCSPAQSFLKTLIRSPSDLSFRVLPRPLVSDVTTSLVPELQIYRAGIFLGYPGWLKIRSCVGVKADWGNLKLEQIWIAWDQHTCILRRFGVFTQIMAVTGRVWACRRTETVWSWTE